MSSLVYEKVAEFKHILRVFNTNLDGKRKVPYALRTIRGVGRRFAHLACKKAKIDPHRRAGDLNEAEAQKLIDIINDPLGNGFPKWFLNRQRDFRDGNYMQLVSNTMDTKIREDVERMKKVRQNRGLRHFWGLKVRGQHSKSTGRRGATIGVVRKK